MANGVGDTLLRSNRLAYVEPGELEMTMMRQYCRAASIRALLAGDGLPEELAELRAPFDTAFKWDFRGTRLNSIHGMGNAGRVRVKAIDGPARLLAGERKVLMSFLNSERLEGKSGRVSVPVRVTDYE